MKYTIQQFFQEYPSNGVCLDRLFRMRFPNPKCPSCGRVNAYHRHGNRASFICNCGKHEISPKVGTIFEKSDTDLVKWFHAMFLMSQSRNGVAALELKRQVGVTYKTVWRMQKLIRETMRDGDFTLSGEVEADETMVGGKAKQKRKMANKSIVFAAVERKGKVQAEVIKDSTEDTLLHAVRENIAKGSLLLTDKLRAYKNIAHIEGYGHEAVHHSAKQYVDGKAHTNTIDGFFSQLKRSLDGTYHVVSPKYLPLYVSEFEFRYNHGRREDVHLFDLLLRRASGHRVI